MLFLLAMLYGYTVRIVYREDGSIEVEFEPP